MSDKLKYYLYLALLYPLAVMPLRVLYVLSDLMYLLFAHVLHYREKVVMQNLTSSFPEKSPQEIEQIKHGFYRHFCDIIVETVKLLHISDKSIKRMVRIENYETVDSYADDNDAMVVFLGHLGNWELVPATTLYYSEAIHSYHIYKPLRDRAADRLMLKVRGRFHSQGIPQATAVRTILRLNTDGRPFIVGFISDQRSNSEVAHQRVDFLNHLTPYNVGGETIGEKIKAKFLYLDIQLERRGRYVMRYIPMHPDPNDTEPHPYTRLYMRLLEDNIRRQPTLWLWSHRRWLYK